MKLSRTALLLALTLTITFFASGQTPQTVQDYLKSSLAHLRAGEIDAALSDSNKALELDPVNVDALFLRAAVRSRKGDTAGTLADYDKILELAPRTQGAEIIYHNRAMMRLEAGNVDGALADLDKGLALAPKAAELYNGRAIARLQKGDLDGALADYEKVIELRPTLPSAFLGRGYFRMQKGDLDGALADFNKALELKPDYADTYVDRAVVYGLKGRIDEAIADFKKGAALRPPSISDVSRGNFTSPFNDLNTFIKAHPANARAYEMRGLFRLLQGKEAEAERDFQKSLELDPKLKPEIATLKEVRKTDKPQ